MHLSDHAITCSLMSLSDQHHVKSLVVYIPFSRLLINVQGKQRKCSNIEVSEQEEEGDDWTGQNTPQNIQTHQLI